MVCFQGPSLSLSPSVVDMIFPMHQLQLPQTVPHLLDLRIPLHHAPQLVWQHYPVLQRRTVHIDGVLRFQDVLLDVHLDELARSVVVSIQMPYNVADEVSVGVAILPGYIVLAFLKLGVGVEEYLGQRVHVDCEIREAGEGVEVGEDLRGGPGRGWGESEVVDEGEIGFGWVAW